MKCLLLYRTTNQCLIVTSSVWRIEIWWIRDLILSLSFPNSVWLSSRWQANRYWFLKGFTLLLSFDWKLLCGKITCIHASTTNFPGKSARKTYNIKWKMFHSGVKKEDKTALLPPYFSHLFLETSSCFLLLSVKLFITVAVQAVVFLNSVALLMTVCHQSDVHFIKTLLKGVNLLKYSTKQIRPLITHFEAWLNSDFKPKKFFCCKSCHYSRRLLH